QGRLCVRPQFTPHLRLFEHAEQVLVHSRDLGAEALLPRGLGEQGLTKQRSGEGRPRRIVLEEGPNHAAQAIEQSATTGSREASVDRALQIIVQRSVKQPQLVLEVKQDRASGYARLSTNIANAGAVETAALEVGACDPKYSGASLFFLRLPILGPGHSEQVQCFRSVNNLTEPVQYLNGAVLVKPGSLAPPRGTPPKNS